MATLFFERQLDYIFFLYGLSFIALGACCASLRPGRTQKLPWKWLKYFALIHGANEWADMISLGSGSGPIFSSIRLTLLALSFGALIEFSRIGIRELGGKSPGRWIHLPLWACAGLGVIRGLPALNATIRYSLGIVGAIWSAAALLRASKAEPATRHLLSLTALLMAGYGLAAGLVVPAAPFFPATRLNQGAFLEHTGLPIQLIRAALALLISGSIWEYYRRSEHFQYPETEALRRRQYGFQLTGLCLVLAAGWGLAEFVGRTAQNEARNAFLNEAQIAAAGLDASLVARLVASPDPARDPSYRLLQSELQEMGQADTEFRQVFVIYLKGGRLEVFPPALAGANPKPQTIQPMARSWAATALQGGHLAEHPFWHNDGGPLVSAFAPVRPAGGSPAIALVGVDISEQVLRRTIALHRAGPIWIVLLLSLLFIGSFVLRRRLWETARLIVLSEKSLNEAQQVAQLGSWTYSPRREQFACSEELKRIFGLNAAESQPTFHTFEQLLCQEDLLRFKAAMRQATETGARFALEVGIRRADGVVRHLLAQAQARRSPQGEVIELVGTIQDITERKAAEAERRESEGRLAQIFDFLPDATFAVDPTGKIIAWNRAIEELTGVKAAAVVGKGNFEYSLPFYGERRPALVDLVIDVQRRAKTGGFYSRVETKDNTLVAESEAHLAGKRRIIWAKACPLYDLHSRVVGAIETVRDITERRDLEQQLRQSQKMEAIGQLAGGVAHDFNNLLAVIRGNAELALMNAGPAQTATTDSLRQVVAASDRAANLTRQLLLFSRKEALQTRPLDLNDVIGNLTKMLKRIIGEDIQLRCNYGTRLPFVQADVSMMEQVLVNLLVNARDAMPQGGQLLITTDKLQFLQVDLHAHPEARAGEFVVLSVADTGAGIAPEHLPHIFEPFFTTKEPGKGTGLGLATVYGIVKQHQGWIEVASQPGQGTTFKVFLPATPRSEVPAQQPNALPPVPTGSETILVVEDESAVRQLTRRLLQSYGYKVEEAASGREALELWSGKLDKIDLLLTDMVMPHGLNGRDLAEKLLCKKPSLRVLFMSGYTGDNYNTSPEKLARLGHRFIQKPFSPRDLLKTVRACFDEPPQGREPFQLTS